MSISSKVKRLLLVRSGGYCGNPQCNSDLYPLFENRVVTNVEELAHIIGQKKGGPRGDTDIDISDRDEYDNVIVLCPTCHRLVDKNPKLYPVDTLTTWKREHEKKIKEQFSEPNFTDRFSLRKELEKLFRENNAVFLTYGPHSNLAKNQLSSAYEMWHQKSIETIIPNNRRIVRLLTCNYELLNDNEKDVLEEFKIHKDGFEYNKLSGDRNGQVVLYPKQMNNILKD